MEKESIYSLHLFLILHLQDQDPLHQSKNHLNGPQILDSPRAQWMAQSQQWLIGKLKHLLTLLLHVKPMVRQRASSSTMVMTETAVFSQVTLEHSADLAQVVMAIQSKTQPELFGHTNQCTNLAMRSQLLMHIIRPSTWPNMMIWWLVLEHLIMVWITTRLMKLVIRFTGKTSMELMFLLHLLVQLLDHQSHLKESDFST